MVQFYFLSVVLNAVAGYLFLSGDDEGLLELKGGFSLKNQTFRLVLGVLLMVTGVIKIFSPLQGIPIIGDLVPGFISIVSSFILIFEYYRNRTTLESTEHTEKVNLLLLGNKRIIGIAALVGAALHFLFPRVPLL